MHKILIKCTQTQQIRLSMDFRTGGGGNINQNEVFLTSKYMQKQQKKKKKDSKLVVERYTSVTKPKVLLTKEKVLYFITLRDFENQKDVKYMQITVKA